MIMTWLRRWRLLWTSLPVPLALTAIKLVLDEIFGFKGLLEFNSDLNVLFTALVFIMGFILAGTITDFKEAERIPGELACQLEIMEDWFVEASVMAALADAAPARPAAQGRPGRGIGRRTTGRCRAAAGPGARPGWPPPGR